MTNNTPHTLTDDGELRKQIPIDFSEEALSLASNIKEKLPNTWELLYHNVLMPEILEFIKQYGNTRAVEARIELHRELSHPHSKSWQNQLYNLDLERLSALTQPQKENK